jgi:N-acetylmuramoyl-L-alanine amidase
MTGRDHRPGSRAGPLAVVALAGMLGLAGACTGPGKRVPQAVAQAAPLPTATVAPPPPSTPPLAGSREASGSRPPGSQPPAATRAPGTRPPGTRRAGTGPPPAATPPAGRVVVLDPGHNGGNAEHPEIINRQVDAGPGQRKACNTVGAQTVGGYPEHAFNFDVALRTRLLLAHHGVTVLLTRPSDTGVGPCVDARARFGNSHRADAVVSIHADGAPAGGTGFHVVEATGSLVGPAVAAASQRLALRVRSAMLAKSGFGYATYVAGGSGLDHRSDLAGLNLATQPSILVECGNMRNAADAARMISPAGRQRIAAALADGILAALSAG